MKLNEISYAPQKVIGGLTKKKAHEAASKLVALIKKTARPWLNQTDNGKIGVYRGSDAGDNNYAYIRAVRDNRRPKDSDASQHEMFNKLIAVAGGIANRNNSMFVTGDESLAETFGKTWVVIPQGKFHYTWNTRWRDWTNDSTEMGAWNYFLNSKIAKVYLKADDDFRAARDEYMALIDKLDDKATKARREKDPNAKKYFQELKNFSKQANKRRWLDTRQLYYRREAAKMRKLPGEEFFSVPAVKKYILVDMGLPKAIKSGHEIMIQCNSAIYIDDSMYDDMIIPMLNGGKPDANFIDWMDDYDDWG